MVVSSHIRILRRLPSVVLVRVLVVLSCTSRYLLMNVHFSTPLVRCPLHGGREYTYLCMHVHNTVRNTSICISVQVLLLQHVYTGWPGQSVRSVDRMTYMSHRILIIDTVVGIAGYLARFCFFKIPAPDFDRRTLSYGSLSPV